jgi:hypothetical protein
MKTKILLSALTLILPSLLSAQNDSLPSPTNSLGYFNQFFSGGLLGKSGTGGSLSASTVHGVRYKKLSIGAGLGYDSYGIWRAMPVVASVGYDLHDSGLNRVFLQLNYGHAWTSNIGAQNSGYIYTSSGGRVINPMVGYRVASGKWRMYLMAGYKFQRINYTQTYKWRTWTGDRMTVEQDMERLSVQLGVGWN